MRLAICAAPPDAWVGSDRAERRACSNGIRRLAFRHHQPFLGSEGRLRPATLQPKVATLCERKSLQDGLLSDLGCGQQQGLECGTEVSFRYDVLHLLTGRSASAAIVPQVTCSCFRSTEVTSNCKRSAGRWPLLQQALCPAIAPCVRGQPRFLPSFHLLCASYPPGAKIDEPVRFSAQPRLAWPCQAIL